MPLNQTLVGKEYPTVTYEVGREKLREFAMAVGETDPVFHDEEAARAAGHPDVVAVPTFPVVVAGKAAVALHGDPNLGLDYTRVVHGEQEFDYWRPIVAGDRLLARSRVAAVEVKGRHELLTIETRITSEDGEPVCTVRNVLLSRGTAPERRPSPGGQGQAQEATG
jgi:acyl dehydratase